MLANDTLENVLFINMTTKSFHVERRPELFEKSIGGTGVGVKLLAENCKEGCDPLGPDNAIVLAVGALTSHYPLCSKTVAMFKSPLTGDLGESHCGGRSAVSIRLAGYGAIVITGQSEVPLYLAIHGDKVHFRDASTLWGMNGVGTVGRVMREQEPMAGMRSIMRIGRGGKKLVKYACVTTETFRHFGRLGLGAVFGSKKLQGIAISGRRGLPLADMKEYRKVYKDIYEAAVESPLMKKYHDLGTPVNVRPLQELGGLPTRNLQDNKIEGFETITGEHYAEKYLGRRLACAHCPVACIHIAALREPYDDEPYFYKTSMISYDYELIYALGSMLGITDSEGLLKLLDEVEEWGLDAMSAGVVLAWATEALEKGLVSEKETEGIKLSWGDWKSYMAALEKVVEQPNDFYAALAGGVEVASQKYGGQDYALSFGKNEMPGYHTGPASHIGYLVSARHSHLCNAGYSVDQKVLLEDEDAREPHKIAKRLIKEESWRQVLSSLAICFFARKLYSMENVINTLKTVGFEFTEEELINLGEEIYREKFAFKKREGFDFSSLRIPKRIFETPNPVGPFDEKFVRDAIECVRSFHED